MIKYITITNYVGEEITIDMYNPEIAKLSIREITGLGPVQANINMTELATDDGSLYNSARAETRNIVLTLGFESNDMIEDSRLLTYKYFPLKQMLKFTIATDRRNLYTYGYVESNEPDIFQEDETCQISIICPKAYFLSEEERDIQFELVVDNFEFPLEEIGKDHGVPVYLKNFTCDMQVPEWENIYNSKKMKTIVEAVNANNPVMNGNEEFELYTYVWHHNEMANYTHQFLAYFTHKQLSQKE